MCIRDRGRTFKLMNMGNAVYPRRTRCKKSRYVKILVKIEGRAFVTSTSRPNKLNLVIQCKKLLWTPSTELAVYSRFYSIWRKHIPGGFAPKIYKRSHRNPYSKNCLPIHLMNFCGLWRQHFQYVEGREATIYWKNHLLPAL